MGARLLTRHTEELEQAFRVRELSRPQPQRAMCSNTILGVWILFTVTACQCGAFFFGNECNGKSYSENTQICCGDKLYANDPHTTCCSGELIDTRTSVCYLGHVLHNPLNGCDGMYYTKTFEFCCNNQIYAKSPTAGCCGSKLYDPTVYQCGLFFKLKPKRQ